MRDRISVRGRAIAQGLKALAPQMRPFFAVIGVVVVFALYALTLGKILDHYVQPGTAQERKDLVGTLATIIAGTLALFSIYPTWRTLRVNQD